MRDIREQFAGLREAEAADRPAPVPAALTPEALEAWGDKLVARVAEAARTADAPGDDEVVARIGRIQEAVAEAAAAVERNNGVLNSIGNELAAATERMKSAVARMETDLATTRAPITRETRRANPTLRGSRTVVKRVSSPPIGALTDCFSAIRGGQFSALNNTCLSTDVRPPYGDASWETAIMPDAPQPQPMPRSQR